MVKTKLNLSKILISKIEIKSSVFVKYQKAKNTEIESYLKLNDLTIVDILFIDKLFLKKMIKLSNKKKISYNFIQINRKNKQEINS